MVRARGLSVRQLSEQANIMYNTALNLCRGVGTRIDFEVLDSLCKVLHVQPGELLVWVPDPEDQPALATQPQHANT
jgi:DNA-binding Xre family transcriptional regulator